MKVRASARACRPRRPARPAPPAERDRLRARARRCRPCPDSRARRTASPKSRWRGRGPSRARCISCPYPRPRGSSRHIASRGRQAPAGRMHGHHERPGAVGSVVSSDTRPRPPRQISAMRRPASKPADGAHAAIDAALAERASRDLDAQARRHRDERPRRAAPPLSLTLGPSVCCARGLFVSCRSPRHLPSFLACEGGQNRSTFVPRPAPRSRL